MQFSLFMLVLGLDYRVGAGRLPSVGFGWTILTHKSLLIMAKVENLSRGGGKEMGGIMGKWW
jgi:hypothetical protein